MGRILGRRCLVCWLLPKTILSLIPRVHWKLLRYVLNHWYNDMSFLQCVIWRGSAAVSLSWWDRAHYNWGFWNRDVSFNVFEWILKWDCRILTVVWYGILTVGVYSTVISIGSFIFVIIWCWITSYHFLTALHWTGTWCPYIGEHEVRRNW